MAASTATTVAHVSEVRAWVLKGYWAEQTGDIDEAKRCFDWAMRLDGQNPETKQIVDEFIARHWSGL